MGKKTKRVKGLDLTGEQRLLVSLHQVGKETTDQSIRETVFSLIRWFQRTGNLTYPQKELARRLVRGHDRSAFLRKIDKPLTKPTYVLYAVRIGAQLKVGHSLDVVSRVKSYRTGTSDVELLATINLGQCTRRHAKNQERKLHKRLRAYRVEREIFNLAALDDFRCFQPAVESLPVERLPRRYETLPEHVE